VGRGKMRGIGVQTFLSAAWFYPRIGNEAGVTMLGGNQCKYWSSTAIAHLL
jgi:hypothetical protein